MTSRTLRLAIVVCALGVLGPAHADQCSGGASGGMDATGNECSDPGVYAVSSPPEPAQAADTPTATKTPQHPSIARVAHQRPRSAHHRAHATAAPQRVSIEAIDP